MFKRCIFLLTILFIVAGTSLAAAASFDQWNIRSPLPTSQKMNGINYVNGMYMSVGGLGTIMTSSDGVSWTSRTSETVMDLNDVSYGNGMYVVVGEFGTILTSSDGVSWTSQTVETSL